MKRTVKYLFLVPVIAYAIKCLKFGVRRERVLLSKIAHDVNKLMK